MSLPEFAPEELIGVPIKQVCTFHSLAFLYNNQELLCHVVNGHPAVFCLIDLKTKAIIFQKTLDGVESSWEMIQFKNKVFIAGTGDSNCFGHLYSFNLTTHELVKHGVVCEGEKFLWSIATDDERYIYIGTWPNGKIIAFDTETNLFSDFGTIVANQNYLRTLTFLNGQLYAGVGPKGSVVQIDPSSFNNKTNKIEKPYIHLEDDVYNLLGIDKKDEHLPFCYELESSYPYLLAFFSTDKKDLLSYNVETKTWKHITDGYHGMMLKDDNGNILYTSKDGLFCFSPVDGDSKLISSKLKTSTKGGGVVRDHIYSVFFNGSILDFNKETETSTSTKTSAEGAATQIQTIFYGPDGNLYFSSYPGGTGAKVDPETKEIVRFPLEQAEGMGALGDDIYFGIYPHAFLYRLDTTKELKEEENPKEVWQFDKYQDRPFVITSGDNKIFAGTIPYYGRLGGGISIWDPKTETGETFAPIIHDQSISSLLYHDGLLFGGTSIFGGLGIEPSEKHAYMFIWSVETKKLVKTFLPLKAAEDATMISGFCKVNDLIYGTFNGYIFAYDINKAKTVKYRNIYPEVTRYGRWRPTFTYLGSDGLLYSSLAGKVTVIDPESLNYKTLAQSDLFALGKDNSIYFAKGWKLYTRKPL